MDTKKAALAGLGCLAVGFVLGYGAGRVSTGTPINPFNPTGQPPAAQAPGTPLANDPNRPPALESSPSISGTAVSATESSLTFDADLTPFDSGGTKGLPVRRTANLSSSTVIVRLSEKTPQEIAADQQAFAEASADPDRTGPPALPSPYKEVKIAATDISAGESLTVEAAADIVKAETFDAIRVVVAPNASAPQVAPPPPAPTTEEPPPPPPEQP